MKLHGRYYSVFYMYQVISQWRRILTVTEDFIEYNYK
jgi:hypothetical protein